MCSSSSCVFFHHKVCATRRGEEKNPQRRRRKRAAEWASPGRAKGPEGVGEGRRATCPVRARGPAVRRHRVTNQLWRGSVAHKSPHHLASTWAGGHHRCALPRRCWPDPGQQQHFSSRPLTAMPARPARHETRRKHGNNNNTRASLSCRSLRWPEQSEPLPFRRVGSSLRQLELAFVIWSPYSQKSVWGSCFCLADYRELR